MRKPTRTLITLFALSGALVGCSSAQPPSPDTTPDASPPAAPPADAATVQTGDLPDDPCQITVFASPQFAGNQACFPTGTFTRAQLDSAGFTDTTIGSVTLDFGYRLTITDATGAVYETTQPTPSVDKTLLPGSVSSVTVDECTAGLFEDSAGHTAGTCLAVGSYDAPALAALGLRPNSTRSVSVAPGFVLTLQRTDGTTTTTDVLDFSSPPLSSPGSTIVSASVAAESTSVANERRRRLGLFAPRHDDPNPTALDAGAPIPPPSGPFQTIYVVGDSLSDQENAFNSIRALYCPNPAFGYWQGRFTNGRNWVDYFTGDNGAAGTVKNLAVGGSLVMSSQIWRPSLMQQAQTIPAAATPNDSLVILWSGSNDVNGAAQKFKGSDADGADQGKALGAQVAGEINAVMLWLKVARNIQYMVVAELPPIQQVPIIRTPAYSNDPERVAFLTQAVEMANTQINTSTQENTSFNDYAGAVAPMAGFILGLINHNGGEENPDWPLMPDVTDACQILGSLNACSFSFFHSYIDMPCNQPGGKMFMDQLHPSSLAHCGLAGVFELTMRNAGYNFVELGSTRLTCPSKEQVPGRPAADGTTPPAPAGGSCTGESGGTNPGIGPTGITPVLTASIPCPIAPPKPGGCDVAGVPGGGGGAAAAVGLALLGLALVKRRAKEVKA
jgi:hypothetical protein